MIYKTRCSSIGAVMTNSRTKGKLSDTAKAAVESEWIQLKYGRTQIFENKYFDKGNQMEDDSITLLSRLTKKFYRKNEEFFSNDFIKGTPDIVNEDCIIDIKSSWSMHTFTKAKREGIDSNYLYQLMGYMALTGRKKAQLIYCLTSASDDLVADEIRRASYRYDFNEDLEKQIRRNMVFEDIPFVERVHVKEIEFDSVMIAEVEDRVIQCREYFLTL